MKKTLFKTSIVMLMALITMSCSKDGATGPAGPAGANGTNGTNGNANVIGTTDFTILTTDWISTSSNIKYVTLQNNMVTQSIVDKGIVMVYQKSGNQYIALPHSLNGFDYNFSFGLNFIQITVSATDLSAFTTNNNMVIRAVAITASNKMAHPNTNWNNYEEVKEVLHLQD